MRHFSRRHRGVCMWELADRWKSFFPAGVQTQQEGWGRWIGWKSSLQCCFSSVSKKEGAPGHQALVLTGWQDCVNMVWCVWIWEVSKHGLNLCSSILFGGGRKAKERRKEMKTDLCPLAKRNIIKRKYSTIKRKTLKCMYCSLKEIHDTSYSFWAPAKSPLSLDFSQITLPPRSTVAATLFIMFPMRLCIWLKVNC